MKKYFKQFNSESLDQCLLIYSYSLINLYPVIFENTPVTASFIFSKWILAFIGFVFNRVSVYIAPIMKNRTLSIIIFAKNNCTTNQKRDTTDWLLFQM